MLTCTTLETQNPYEWIRTANKETSRSGLLPPVKYLRNGKRYSSFVFTLANRKSHATKRCNPRLCSCYRFWDNCSRQHQDFSILTSKILEQVRICRRTSSHGIIKKYSRSWLFFRSNISETVGDIRVLFSLWPRAIVALSNGANDVSVVLIVFEIWSRQHQNFGMLTCSSERNQHPYECIRTANKKKNKNKNKEITCSGLWLPVEYLRNGKRYSSFVFTLARSKSHATKRWQPTSL